jgi:hypothetical protein
VNVVHIAHILCKCAPTCSMFGRVDQLVPADFVIPFSAELIRCPAYA